METVFEKGDHVAVLSGVLDSTGVVSSSVSICIVMHVGCNDLFVETRQVHPSRFIVSKTACTKICVTPDRISASEPTKAQIGDMVLYHDKIKWSDKEPTKIIGTVYEINYRAGAPHTATVMIGTEMVQLSYSSLLVLQKLM